MKKILLLFLVLFFSSSCSDEKKDDTITFVINQWFPYELWNEEDKKIEGATGEYVDLIFRELGYKTKFIVESDFSKALVMVSTKKVDAIYTLLETPERTETMYFSNSIITPYESLFYINKTKNPELLSADVLSTDKKLIFGSVVGETESEITIKNNPNFTFIRTFKKYQDLMYSLDIDVINVALLEKYNGLYEYNQYIKSKPDSTFSLGTTNNVSRQDLKIAFTKDERGEKLKKLFDAKNNEFKKTDVLEELFEKYIGKQ